MNDVNIQTLTPRERYRLRKQQRETVVFTVLGTIMVVVATCGILIGFGIVPFPFFNGFTENTKIATAGSVPCPVKPEKYLDPANIEVVILNGTDTSGLAGKVKEKLEGLGFTVTATDNASEGAQEGVALITAGPLGVNGAYTLAEAFPESRLTLDSRTDYTVTVTIGPDFDTTVTDKAFHKALEKKQPTPRQGCLHVSLNDE